jgi:alpha-1,2-mannosyltransferase
VDRLRRLPPYRTGAGLVAIVTGALVAILNRTGAVYGTMTADLIDLRVYRMGGRSVLTDGAVYDAHFEILGLPFTYPPVSAVLMVPLTVVPLAVAAVLWTAASVLCLAWVWRVFLPRADWRLVLALLTGSLFLEPVRENLAKGQINLFLMAMVVGGLLGAAPRPVRRPRDNAVRWMPGVAVGVAAGLKLTPVFFLVFLAVTRRWTALRNAVLGMLGTVAFGFVVLPQASMRYWGSVVRDSGRIGNPYFAGNQSVMGLLSRIGYPDSWVGQVWLLAAGLAGAGALLLAWRLWRRGDRPAAVSAAALGALFASPVSWTHHWVWAVPLGVVLVRTVRGRRARLVTGLAWYGLFLAGPMWWVPWYGETTLHWTVWQSLPGNAYLIAGAVWFVVLARHAWRPMTPPAAMTPRLQAAGA